jgi:cytochrome c553
MLGTVSDFSLRAGQASVAIVRCTAPARQPGQPQTYMFATDGSRAAALAFCVTCHQ